MKKLRIGAVEIRHKFTLFIIYLSVAKKLCGNFFADLKFYLKAIYCFRRRVRIFGLSSLKSENSYESDKSAKLREIRGYFFLSLWPLWLKLCSQMMKKPV